MPIRSLPSPALLLDTHVWVWSMEGDLRQLGRRAADGIRHAAGLGNVLVSPISAWEVGMLEARGRLRLAMDAREWVRRALTAPGVRVAELTPETVVDTARLPGEIHRDPADRMLVATARRLGARLVTRDAALLAYAAAGHLSVLDATP
jgi:PIN domain nuclease of toxin-antitoxin system